MDGTDAETVRRYADEGFEEVLIWTDQVWPSEGSPAEKRTAMRAAADALGVERRTPAQ